MDSLLNIIKISQKTTLL